MTLDFSRPVTTRDGRAVRILCTDAPGAMPVIGIIDGLNGPTCWPLSGELSTMKSLINPPVKRRGWVAIYKGSAYQRTIEGIFLDEAEARVECPRAIAFVQLPEWEEPL